jgi:geranylgeranyl transferase type-1 subunit beta
LFPIPKLSISLYLINCFCFHGQILNSISYIDRESNVSFVLGNQNPLTGGIGKYDNDYSDPLHTFLGLAGLALVDYEGLNAINPQLTMSENAVKHLQVLQLRWKQEVDGA